ncbi:MAG: hypothetical protein JSR18_00825 [Proteobacteria bacterium]|nr:hypothetical protein [Pseudomonadota bacterium]
MTTIISGRFVEQSTTDQALEALVAAGFPRDRCAAFFVNDAGQHDLYPVGGDEAESPGTEMAPVTAVEGAAGGAAVGALAGALAGPAGAAAGAAVGAYVGSLHGAVAGTDEKPVPGAVNADPREFASRKAGMMLSVETPDADSEMRAKHVLREAGAFDLEKGQGHIVGGDWTDLDPLTPVRRV